MMSFDRTSSHATLVVSAASLEEPAIPPGYKQTEVGVIPVEWEVAVAAEICDLVVDCKNRTPLKKIGGSTVGHAKVDDIRNLEIPFPPLKDEQRAIAAALSDVDALIAALDALIAKKRAIKTATMQQLLTGERRLPGFSGFQG